ncbi:MAG: exonuclease subunit SbcD, partial [Deltaproteobacteria bacterium]|nr:exonuclease subunit SbcD [Deltaproteobacteria bacterium]
MPELYDPRIRPKQVFQSQADKPSWQGPKLTVIHTSDWHLGRSLYKIRSRNPEMIQFLAWLTEVIEAESADVLLAAGDIFDSTAPSVQSQQIYYNFLERVKKTSCHNLVLIGGNHDSAAFLSAPEKLLKIFHIYVSADGADPEREVMTLSDPRGRPILVAAAVPFLRDRDLRLSLEGETIEDKDRSLIEGLRLHYQKAGGLAARMQAELGGRVPVFGLGHLFAQGGRTSDDDGVRELYAGALARIDPAAFPEVFDYLALGHLHRPQKAGLETIRYSGSPLPMSFSENAEKSVTMVTVGEGE